jgi:hypothetical protein
VYEVVKTVTTIYPNAVLLDAAATSISRFIRSDSHNLKYIGIKGLAAIVKDYPKYALLLFLPNVLCFLPYLLWMQLTVCVLGFSAVSCAYLPLHFYPTHHSVYNQPCILQ